MESFFDTLKTERLYHFHFTTREQARQVVFEYIEVFYNQKRQHCTLGYQSPTQFLAQWISKQHQEKLVA